MEEYGIPIGSTIRILNEDIQEILLDEGYYKTDLITDEVIDILEHLDIDMDDIYIK